MIKLRLQRKGRIRRPIYHIVVADSRAKRDGRIIEQVGRYDNVSEKKEVVLNEDRILYWLDTGAQPTDTVRSILRNEGVLYKRHLIRWGKSEEEIAAAMNEWSEYRASKKETETTRKEQIKAVLATEEKEFKNQVNKKATEAAEEIAEEAEATAEVTEAVEEVVADEATEAAVEETTEEAVAETEEAVAEETTEEVVEETAAEETVEEAAPEVEEEVAEAPAEEAVAEETTEEVVEEPVVEAAVEEEAPAEEAAAETTGSVSSDLSAKEAIDHIKANSAADLAGFVTDSETRKTVLAAWEAKQAE